MTLSPRWAGAAVVALLLPGCLAFHSGPMPGEPRGATFATLHGVRVRYVDRGEGPPVVLLHGFASALETWSGVMPALQPRHRVVALDLKGFGWTDRPAGDYGPQAQARLVVALLDHLGIAQADVVAHSWGASVALALAADQPDRVRRVALYDAWALDVQLPTFFRWARVGGVGEALFGLFYAERPEDRIARAFFDPTTLTEAFLDEVRRALERPGTTAAALAAARGQRFDELEARWRTVRQPVLLLWGENDAVSWPADGARLQHLLPDARLRMYPRCGHFPMIEAPVASTADLVAFLDGGLR